MKVALTRTYRRNREAFSAHELRRFRGQWVAFSADGLRIVASADSIGQLCERMDEAHVDMGEVVLERIEFGDDDFHLGGAETMEGEWA